MEVTYSCSKNIAAGQLQNLFTSINWDSGKYPEKLSRAIYGHSFVYTAWDCDRLIGLISVMDDNELNANITYLLVHPKYQKKGIGSELISFIKKKYKNYLNVSLISYSKSVSFYNTFGFKNDRNAIALRL